MGRCSRPYPINSRLHSGAGFRGAIGTSSLDVAMAFPHSSLSKSLTIRAQLAAAAGEAGMEVQLSVYQTE
jgi:hypothetical protein